MGREKGGAEGKGKDDLHPALFLGHGRRINNNNMQISRVP